MGPIAGTALSIALSIILQQVMARGGAAIANKIDAKNTVPGNTPGQGDLVNRAGTAYLPTTGINPANGRQLYPPKGQRNWTQITPSRTTPTPRARFARGVGNVGAMLGTTALMSIPHLLNLGGKVTQAAGTTAGAVAQAAGNVPGHIAAMTPQRKRDVYGGTVLDAVGGIASDVGTAAGTALSGAGNALGTSMSDIGNYMRIMNLQNTILGNVGKVGRQIQQSNMNPAQLRFLEQLTRTSGRISGVHP